MNLRYSIPLLCITPLTNAFSFWFTGTPTQCANMTVQWTNGNPPYELLIVPTGHVTPETRVIMDNTIQSGNSYSFVLKLPADSSFVAVMNDNSGIGAGGTSAVTKVASSNDKSCLSTTPSSPEFFLFTNPSTPQQCEPMEISYNQGAQPPVDILGVIPGGDSFEVAKGSPSNSSFDWTANVKEGTQMLFVAGDTKGAGTGGSSDLLNVQDGGDSSCLASDSPSSTAGNPVGGVSTAASPTQSGAQSGSSGSSSSSSGVSGSGSSSAGSGSGSSKVVGGSNSGSGGSNPAQTGASGDPGSGGGTVTGGGSSATGVLPVVTSSSKSKVPTIIGAVVGSVALIAALTLALLIFMRRRRRSAPPTNRDSQYSDTDHLQAPSPRPWTPVSSPAGRSPMQPPDNFPSFYHAEPFIPPTSPFVRPSDTSSSDAIRKPTLVARASSGTRTAHAEFSRDTFSVGAPEMRGEKERGGLWGDERDAGSEVSGVADRGHTVSTAPSTVDVPPAYERIDDSRPVRW